MTSDSFYIDFMHARLVEAAGFALGFEERKNITLTDRTLDVADDRAILVEDSDADLVKGFIADIMLMSERVDEDATWAALLVAPKHIAAGDCIADRRNEPNKMDVVDWFTWVTPPREPVRPMTLVTRARTPSTLSSPASTTSSSLAFFFEDYAIASAFRQGR